MGIQTVSFNGENTAISIVMKDGSVLFDDANLPPDNEIRRMLAEWLAGGGEISPYAPLPTIDSYRRAIQDHVDATARARSYDSGVTFSSYVVSTIPAWAAEAAAFVAWRDAVWAYAYAELAKVEGGQRAQPTVAEIIAELPAIVWPG